MNRWQLKPITLTVITLLGGLLIALIEIFIKGKSDGTLLLTLTFWVALVQGPVAVAAAADLSQGKWIAPIKKELFTFYPLILFMALLFLLMFVRMDIYQWTLHPGKWLNSEFFIGRNFILLLLSFICARLYVSAALKESPRKGFFAVLYILSFIIVQSLVAFDWVMSLEFPWMSTMFAPIFFMESFYAGLAVAAMVSAYLVSKNPEQSTALSKVMRDSAQFMFGFALAWAGLYYGQFLVVWYGNIPWETGFFATRMDHSPFREMMYLIILFLFIIPFLGLIGKKLKTYRGWVSIMAAIVLAGILIERIFYILPVTNINFLWLVVEFVVMAFIYLLFFINRKNLFLFSALQHPKNF